MAPIPSGQFLFDGGEMGKLIRSRDWSLTPLGDLNTWPQSLRTSLSICLNSNFPTAIWWGNDLILLYNDSFSTLLGTKHPFALGSKGKDIWREVGIHVDLVLKEANTIISDDEKFLVNRNGIEEECYLRFSHSPIYGESGKISGVFTSALETPSVFLNKPQVIRQKDHQIFSLITQAPIAISILKGPDLVIQVVNKKMLDLWGKTADQVMHKSVNQVLPESMTPGIDKIFETVYLKGEQLVLHEVRVTLPRKVRSEEFYIKIIYEALREVDGTISGIMILADEITEQVKSRKISGENETRLKMAVESTGLGTWDYSPLSGELTWSEECQKIYELPAGQKIDIETFSKQIHPDDKKFVESEIQKSMDPTGNGSYDITYRIIRFTDHCTRWIKAQGKVYFNSENQPERFIGTVVDTTHEEERNLKLMESELRMRLAIQASEMGTFDWDIVTSDFQYSDRMATIFGFTDTVNLKHSDFSDRIHPDDRKMRQEAHEIAFNTGVLFYEARIIWLDISEHWVRVNGQVIYNVHGNVQRMYGTTLDITEQKNQTYKLEKKVAERTSSLQKKNEELIRSEERYHKMTEEVQDYAIILLDKNGIILNWNRGAEKIKGYKQEEILGKSFKSFYLDQDRKNMLPEKLINEAVQNGRAMQEGYRKRKDGSAFWGSIVITALHDDQNNIIGFSKVTRDLTERKEAEDKMKQYTSELLLRNQELEQFAYIASHDLQEPLRKIKTFADVLEKNLEDIELRQKYFDKIQSSAKRMSDQITSVLNYSRLANSESLLERIDLNVLLEDVKTDYELLIEERGAIITSDILPTLQCIPLQISQLFANLMGNSLKFSEVSPIIKISSTIFLASEIQKKHPTLKHAEKYVELVFSDNGIGFEQQYASKIFTIFQRLNRREDYAGTGIGLALCKKIVDNHKGHIEAQSSMGKGAQFFIYLPVS